MAGSAGSKYGIVDDEIPVKKNRPTFDADDQKEADKLRDIRALLRERALKNTISKRDSK